MTPSNEPVTLLRLSDLSLSTTTLSTPVAEIWQPPTQFDDITWRQIPGSRSDTMALPCVSIPRLSDSRHGHRCSPTI
jgi:hypothetical protein